RERQPARRLPGQRERRDAGPRAGGAALPHDRRPRRAGPARLPAGAGHDAPEPVAGRGRGAAGGGRREAACAEQLPAREGAPRGRHPVPELLRRRARQGGLLGVRADPGRARRVQLPRRPDDDRPDAAAHPPGLAVLRHDRAAQRRREARRARAGRVEQGVSDGAVPTGPWPSTPAAGGVEGTGPRSVVGMRELQRRIVEEMGVQPDIDPATEIERRVRFLADYLEKAGARGYVLGISGGLDSTLAGRLAQLAVERRRAAGGDAVFVAARLPYRVQHDEDDAQAALEFVAADEVVTFDVGEAVDAFEAEYLRATGRPVTDFTKGNTKARLRMVAQYALAGDRGLVVIGTDHGSESVTRFFTKFGDGAADVLPLFGLDKRQNREVLRELGAPERLWAKVPTAD